MTAETQIDQQMIRELQTICAGEADHVTFMAGVAAELFHGVEGFDWFEF